MEYLKYEKAFVMLEEQGREFAARGIMPMKGHVKVETGNGKGAIRINVQNLKFFESGSYIYKLILFGKRREKTIYATVGTVALNKQGNGEAYFRFNPKDLDGNEHELSDFSHVIVAALSMRNQKEALHPVLMGVLDLPFPNRNAEQEPVMAARDNGESDSERELNFQPTSEGVAEGDSQSEPEPELEAASQAESDPRKEFLQESGEAVCLKKSEGSYNRFYDKFLAESCKWLKNQQEGLDQVEPFAHDKTLAKWKKVPDAASLPVVTPGGRYLSEKYKHYLFGETEELYFVGVPGRFLKQEQPDGGLSGFSYWQPIRGAEAMGPFKPGAFEPRYKSAYGYWIVAINKETGEIFAVE